MTSRSRKDSSCICISCEAKSRYYVAILKEHSGSSTIKHWFVCLNCYEADNWQVAVARIKPPTKSTKPKRIRKPSVKLQAGAWEDSIEANIKPSVDW